MATPIDSARGAQTPSPSGDLTSSSDTGQNSALRHAQRTLNTAAYWFFACGAIAAYTGVTAQPPASYSAGAAIIGVAWALSLVIFWRTRPTWSFAATMIFVLGLSILRDRTFPGTGFLQGIHGAALALASGLLILWISRRSISRYCRLDRHDSSA